jgi:hypothetical protein
MNNKSSNGKSGSWHTPGLGQEGVQEDDLIKNQWIPFAGTTVFLLLTVLLVIFVGNKVVRGTEPIAIPSLAPTTLAPSPTVMVIASDTPSPTVVVATPSPITVRVLPNSANVRAAPSTTAKVLGQLKKGTVVSPLVRSEDGRWLLIVGLEQGITGWVASELFETVSGDLKILPTIVPMPP